jgi:hypothetical protein
MRLVEGRPVAGVDAQPLAADDIAWREPVGELGVLHHLADLGAHELRRRLVRFVAEQQVGEGGHEAQPAIVPALLELALPLRFGCRNGRGHVDLEVDAGRRRLGALAHRRVVGLDLADVVRIERSVVRRDCVVGGALEHGDVARLLGDHRDRLDRR